MSQQMFKVTAVRVLAALQTFSRLINSVVDNGLLHTGYAATRHTCCIRV